MPDPTARHDANRRWIVPAVIVLVALVVVFSWQTWRRAMRPNGNDFTSYLLASHAFWSGGNPYNTDTPFPFIYPLFLCVVLRPLALLPYEFAVLLWYALAWIFLITASLVFLRLFDSERHPRRWTIALAVLCVATANVIQSNLLNGQVNFLVVASCAGFAWAYARGRGAVASVWLGAAMALKITPAVLLLFLVRRREWRRTLESIAAAAVFGVVLPWFVAGSRIFGYYRHYLRTFLAPRLTAEALHQADPATFTVVSVFRDITGRTWQFDTLLASLIVVLVLLLSDRGMTRPSRHVALMVSLYLGAILLMTPMSEVHHLAFLLPALALLTWESLAGWSRRGALLGLVGIMLAMLIMSVIQVAAFAAVVGTCAFLVARTRRVDDLTTWRPPPGGSKDVPEPH